MLEEESSNGVRMAAGGICRMAASRGVAAIEVLHGGWLQVCCSAAAATIPMVPKPCLGAPAVAVVHSRDGHQAAATAVERWS